jgi:hypothetical protein
MHLHDGVVFTLKGKKMITQDVIKEYFDYKDGILYWKKSKRKIKVGDVAGHFSKGYLVTKFNYKNYYNHRLIYLYHHNKLPNYIDHINGNKADNRIENLRETSLTENQFNRTTNNNSSSGIKNISWFSPSNKWRVVCQINKKFKHFGLYDNLYDASHVARRIRNKYHGEFVNHG